MPSRIEKNRHHLVTFLVFGVGGTMVVMGLCLHDTMPSVAIWWLIVAFGAMSVLRTVRAELGIRRQPSERERDFDKRAGSWLRTHFGIHIEDEKSEPSSS